MYFNRPQKIFFQKMICGIIILLNLRRSCEGFTTMKIR
jgi:hypothetical protein